MTNRIDSINTEEVLRIKRFALDFSGAENTDDRVYRAAVFLLLAGQVGYEDLAVLANISGLPDTDVREFAETAHKNGIFMGDGKISASWSSEDGGGLNFMLDCMCLTGVIQRGSTGKKYIPKWVN